MPQDHLFLPTKKQTEKMQNKSEDEEFTRVYKQEQ